MKRTPLPSEVEVEAMVQLPVPRGEMRAMMATKEQRSVLHAIAMIFSRTRSSPMAIARHASIITKGFPLLEWGAAI